MTVEELERLYFHARRIEQGLAPDHLMKGDAGSLCDALGEAIAIVCCDADDRDIAADAEWFAGLEGVVATQGGRWLKWADEEDWLSIGCRVCDSQFWILGTPFRYVPTRGQVLDLMAALGKKGGDA